MARLLRRLIELDLVAERVSPRDRRRSLLRMTPRGENILFEVGYSLDGAVLDTALTGMGALREAGPGPPRPPMRPSRPGRRSCSWCATSRGPWEWGTLRSCSVAANPPCL